MAGGEVVAALGVERGVAVDAKGEQARHDEINGTGSDVVHYRGEPGPGVLHYAGPSLIQLDLAPATVRSHRRFMQPHLKQLLLGTQQLEEGEAA
ncbi:hypothetical protein [Streptomyces mirabilis]|uniref:hypothetical protein n=1 Tax=Streptomyces mirabilis TaxID=68239 RepID=UPI0032532294